MITAVDSVLQSGRQAVEAALVRLCAHELDAVNAEMQRAVSYSLLGGGKRLRAVLLLEAYSACGGKGDATELAAALEIVHAYSLVHDDLPCMDDDDMRRGRPTVHKVFGTRTATISGLSMVPLAAKTAYKGGLRVGLCNAEAAECVRDLMIAAGAQGMIGGQLLDLEAEGLQLSLVDLERVHNLKTGALIAASVTIGARAAGAGRKQREAFARYGTSLGLAFQIADDVLDVTATTAQIGKTAGRDAALKKSTYPALLGIDGALARASGLVDEACEALKEEGLLTTALEAIARFIVERQS